MAINSAKSRFVFKLLTNAIMIFISFFTLSIVARTLGPRDLGQFDFVTTTLTDWFTLLSLNLPAAFFNWTSRKSSRESSVAFWVVFAVALALLAIIGFGMLLLLHFGFASIIWPDTSAEIMIYAILFAFFSFLFNLSTSFGDGRALPLHVEFSRLFQSLFKLTLILSLVGFGLFTITSYLYISISTTAISFLFLIGCLVFDKKLLVVEVWDEDVVHQVRSFLAFSWRYLKPLIMATFMSLIYAHFDRWVLQFVGGSTEQGFYSLAYRLCSLGFLFNAALSPVIGREFAFSYENNDSSRLALLLEHVKFFVFLASVSSIFISVFADPIVALVGGQKFSEAGTVVAVMALYPIHHALGFTNTFLLGTAQTKAQGLLNTGFLLTSMVGAYFLIASSEMPIPGLGLGALGLAIKMVACQCLFNNIATYLCVRFLRESFKPWIYFQFRLICLLFAVAVLVKMFSNWAFTNLYVGCLFSAAAYVLLVILFVNFAPRLFGIETSLKTLKEIFKLRFKLRSG